ncbi:MAG: hypothetical protein COZ86_04365, partial [Candidatus Moranbacteria bacterium CG_4_8_14_3_um_filter_41_13]
ERFANANLPNRSGGCPPIIYSSLGTQSQGACMPSKTSKKKPSALPTIPKELIVFVPTEY